MDNEHLHVIIAGARYSYDEVLITKQKLYYDLTNDVGYATMPYVSVQCKRDRCTRTAYIKINALFVNYFINTLDTSMYYRCCVLKHMTSFKVPINVVKLQLDTPDKQIIDYAWNRRTQYLARYLCELDNNLSWLSTLGGAFSSLGDDFSYCAVMARRISFNQMDIACRMGDPVLGAKCLLFLSLSYVQQGNFKVARRMITFVYGMSKTTLREDRRLRNMCFGIWSKLQYEHYKNRRHLFK